MGWARLFATSATSWRMRGRLASSWASQWSRASTMLFLTSLTLGKTETSAWRQFCHVWAVKFSRSPRFFSRAKSSATS